MASAEATAGSLAREVRRIALVAVAVAVVLLAVNVGTRAHQLVSIDPTVARYRDVEEQLDAFHGALVDEETGARGYLATGDSSFLQPYRAGVAAEAAATADLGRLVDRGRQAADLVAMESRAQTWTDDWALPAASSTPPVPAGTASPAMTAFLLEGKRLFDDYRSAHDRLSADVRSDLAHAMATQRSWLLASGALEAVIAVAVVAGTLAGHRRLVRRVARPVQALSEAVSRIG
ncbi:MAG TPA: CHASE3 domain-containing protein, partial [Acidimicrobiales bacterium]|nr:CHASE3 domain-containing protein [Acidimicrobiales bacterium]